jgi:hypothetical protein
MLFARYIALSIHQKARTVYRPNITSAQPRRWYQLGAYHAMLLDTVESAGPIQYLYVLVVYGEDRKPVLFVASETSEMPPLLGPAPPFPGLFDLEGHRNLGSDERWAHKEQFVAEALNLARSELKVTESAILLQQEE